MRYREHAPPAHLAAAVECFWTYDTGPGQGPQRVLPDGCEDIVFLPESARLAAVGAMTRAEVYEYARTQTVAGVRFRPSMARPALGVAASELTDSMVDLADLWGARGAALQRRMSGARDGRASVEMLARELAPVERTGEQRMVLWVAEHGGRVRLDDLARFAGLSQRHLRRVFLEQTGLSPKLFCRVVRFRGVVERLAGAAAPPDWAELALEHGFYDQSHLVNEFRALSGVTPGQFAARP